MVDSSGSGASVKRVWKKGATVLNVDVGQRQLKAPSFDVQLDEERDKDGERLFILCI